VNDSAEHELARVRQKCAEAWAQLEELLSRQPPAITEGIRCADEIQRLEAARNQLETDVEAKLADETTGCAEELCELRKIAFGSITIETKRHVAAVLVGLAAHSVGEAFGEEDELSDRVWDALEFDLTDLVDALEPSEALHEWVDEFWSLRRRLRPPDAFPLSRHRETIDQHLLNLVFDAHEQWKLCHIRDCQCPVMWSEWCGFEGDAETNAASMPGLTSMMLDIRRLQDHIGQLIVRRSPEQLSAALTALRALQAAQASFMLRMSELPKRVVALRARWRAEVPSPDEVAWINGVVHRLVCGVPVPCDWLLCFVPFLEEHPLARTDRVSLERWVDKFWALRASEFTTGRRHFASCVPQINLHLTLLVRGPLGFGYALVDALEGCEGG
jgi:hypothetical protein